MDLCAWLALLSLIVAVVSAVAAFQSAATAREANEHSRLMVYHSVCRDVALAALDSGHLAERIKELVIEVRLCLKDMEHATGSNRHSYIELRQQEVDRRETQAKDAAQGLVGYLSDGINQTLPNLDAAQRACVTTATKLRTLKTVEQWLLELIEHTKQSTRDLTERRGGVYSPTPR